MPGGPELSEKVPDEIFQLVESFKKFIREQKAYRDQKFDVDPILEVEKEAEDFMLALQRVSVESAVNAQLIQQIKNDTTKLLRHAELAYSLLRPYLANNASVQQQQLQQQQQNQFGTTFGLTNNNLVNSTFGHQTNGMSNRITKNHSLEQSSFLLKSNFQQNQDQLQLNQAGGHHNQFSNTTSSQYFAELAEQFESRMRAYGDQIKELKLSMDSIVKTYNADELFKWLKKQHETLGETAARVYMTHERIMEKQSELDKTIAQNIFTKTFNLAAPSVATTTTATTQ